MQVRLQLKGDCHEQENCDNGKHAHNLSHLQRDDRTGISYHPTRSHNATVVERRPSALSFLNTNSSQHNLIHVLLFSARSLWSDAFQALMRYLLSRWYLHLKANASPYKHGGDMHGWHNHPSTGIFSKECGDHLVLDICGRGWQMRWEGLLGILFISKENCPQICVKWKKKKMTATSWYYSVNKPQHLMTTLLSVKRTFIVPCNWVNFTFMAADCMS